MDSLSEQTAPTRESGQGTVVERISKYGMRVMPGSFQRRSQLDAGSGPAPGQQQRDAPESGSLTSAMRKKYLKDLLLRTPSSHSGLSSVLSSHSFGMSVDQDAEWALYPMEHAWMLSAVEGNYDTIVYFLSADPLLLTRRDFISGFSVLHWIAKKGTDETLVRLMRYVDSAGIPVNVDLRGSGGWTPLHVASMHRQFMVIKLLVGAFGANVDVMDYSGRRAWQYLGGEAPKEMRELLGAWDHEHCCGMNDNNNTIASVETETGNHAINDEEPKVETLDRTRRGGSWRFGSFRKLLTPFRF